MSQAATTISPYGTVVSGVGMLTTSLPARINGVLLALECSSLVRPIRIGVFVSLLSFDFNLRYLKVINHTGQPAPEDASLPSSRQYSAAADRLVRRRLIKHLLISELPNA